jgi:FKBP-type peptidyl-prolyl cis-trans isomerase
MQKILIGLVVGALLGAGGTYFFMNNETTGGETREIAEGLTIRDVAEGQGVEAQTGQLVAVYYTGTLDDGTVFDSSSAHGLQPLVFQVGNGDVIEGWDRGILGMKVGGTRELTIAPELAYGDQANGPIPANSTEEE